MNDLKVGDLVWKIRISHSGKKYGHVSYMVRHKYQLWNGLTEPDAEVSYEQKPATATEIKNLGSTFTYLSEDEARYRALKTLREVQKEYGYIDKVKGVNA